MAWALLVIALAPVFPGGAIAPAAAAAAGSGAAVVGLRAGQHPDRVRIVLDVTEPLPFSVQVLQAPDRLVVDLPEVAWRAADALPPPRASGGLIAGLRRGVFRPGTLRLVFDLRGPVAVTQTMQLPPGPDGFSRLVIDVTPSRAAPAVAAERPAADAPDTARADTVARTEFQSAPPPGMPVPELKPDPALRARAEKRIVVIDPGHGGRDVGAVGVTGTYEKEVVLAMAELLRERLLATGRYDVVLTREGDTYVGLRDRLKIARNADADAFISLHADSLDDNSLRGASVYTLSDQASDKEAAALAASHNKADILNGLDLSGHDPEVQRILIDLAQRDTNNRSIDFASGVVTELGNVTQMLRRNRRHGGFAVLKSPDVPSVLVELGFMSNSIDEANLRDPGHRGALADALVRGLDRFLFEDRPS